MNDTVTMPPPSIPRTPPTPPTPPAPTPAPAPRPTFVGPQPYALGFTLFLVLNFVLFVRPAEIFPPLLGLELYLAAILLCLLASVGAVTEQLRPSELERRPLTLCVLGITLAMPLSHLASLRFELAWQWGFDHFKVLLYYLLFVGLIRDFRRLRTFLFWMTLFIVFSTGLTVLEFHEVLKLPGISKLKDGEFIRLRGSGIFQDPNDLCVLLVAGLMLCGYFLTEPRSGGASLLWLAPTSLLFYALLLTQSRGGLVALMIGLAVLFRARFGGFLAFLLAVSVLPAVLLFIGGRQADLSTGQGTSQERIGLWSDGLLLFRGAPVFGIGRDQYVEEVGQAAHNSYLHGLTELGLFGGTFFVGGFAYALFALDGLRRGRTIVDPELRRLQPYVMASLAGYMAGMMSLSLTYLIPTYTMLGMAAVLLRLTPTDPPRAEPRCDLGLMARLFGVTVLFLIALSIFVRLTRS